MNSTNDSATTPDSERIGLAEHSELLERKLAQLNRRHFDGAIGARVMWGIPLVRDCPGEAGDAASPVPAAAYNSCGVIVVHPALRDKTAPQYVLEYLIYHECLHELFPVSADENPHPPELIEWEKKAPKKEQAQRWLARHGFPVFSA